MLIEKRGFCALPPSFQKKVWGCGTMTNEETENLKEKKTDKSIMFLIIFVIIIFLISSIGSYYIGYSTGTQQTTESEARLMYSGTECSLRSNEKILWLPDIVLQKDASNNLIGIPSCIPYDRNTSKRIEKI